MSSAALHWHDARACVLPVSTDGSKQPDPEQTGHGSSWKKYETERPMRVRVVDWAMGADGIGLVCGAVSGGLEMLELEGTAVAEFGTNFLQAVADALPELAVKLTTTYKSKTPSGGWHFIYRVDGIVPGNTGLAHEMGENGRKGKVLIETRGEGGFTVEAPSAGRTHRDGAYTVVQGAPGVVATLTADEHTLLHDVARTFTRWVPPAPQPRREPRPRADGEISPGDGFNARTTWPELLESYGWTFHHRYGEVDHWTRPGKDRREGSSATTNYGGSDRLWVFSTSTELDTERSYDRFGFYTAMEHGGDFSKAAAELRRQGYGNPPADAWREERVENERHLTLILGEGWQEVASAPQSPEQPPGGAWTPVDLSAVVEGLVSGSLVRPVPTVGLRGDGAGIFYKGKVNGVAGASGSGKSWTALLACVQAIARGEDVVYIDYESDAAEMVGRLLDLGADPGVITGRFHYIQPDRRLGEDGAAALAGLVRRTAAALVVIDSVGESMAVEGDSPNDDDDTARWFRRFPTMLAALGPAVVVIDHVTKADDREPGLWPIGSQRKRAAISGAQYMQRVGKPFAKGQPGSARIICAKDRAGTYRQGEHVATLTVTPGGPVFMELRAPAPTTEAPGMPHGGFRPTTLMEKISRALEAAPEPLSLSNVHDVVSGKESAKTTALQTLVDEGYVSRTRGARNSKLHKSVRAYRKAEDPRSDTYVPPGETVTDSTTTATVSVSLEGETERRSLDHRPETVGRRSETVGDGHGQDPHRPARACPQQLAIDAS